MIKMIWMCVIVSVCMLAGCVPPKEKGDLKICKCKSECVGIVLNGERNITCKSKKISGKDGGLQLAVTAIKGDMEYVVKRDPRPKEASVSGGIVVERGAIEGETFFSNDQSSFSITFITLEDVDYWVELKSSNKSKGKAELIRYCQVSK